jgi:pimeloyl-ACP methyl ester carboxylesterase
VLALVVITAMAIGLALLSLPAERDPSVPAGARAGDLTMAPCRYDTEAGELAADCGTLVVPENRRDPDSALIALPVIRIRATGDGQPAEPIFWLEGGPGQSNMTFREANRLTERHDVVLVGYRGVDSSTVLDCPEVTSALQGSADLIAEQTQRRRAEAFARCADRLTEQGIDLAGYTLPQRVDDFEAARTALGYDRISLLSVSAGTRTAMIYSWRHPESLHRSVMIGANPPGHFLWDPTITDTQLDHYAQLCRQDAGCAARTPDLAAAMRATAADIPDNWGILPIKDGNVRASTLFGLFNNTPSAAPLNAPATLDAWLGAAGGDPSGFWAMSVLADLALPQAFVWGEFAASGMIDAEVARDYYTAGGDPGTILGNASADFLWAGGQLAEAWPSGPETAEYRQLQDTTVETLLISGTVDFSTPAQLATDELLPALPNGHQVILAELGHTDDFWYHQPAAGQQLITAFLDRGEIDQAGYETRPVRFDPGFLSLSTIAVILLATLSGLVVLALAVLVGMARRRGARRRPSAWLRVSAPPVLALGAWSLTLLAALILWPGAFLGSALLAVLPMGVAAGLGVHLAGPRVAGLTVPVLGGVAGAWLASMVAAGFVGAMTALAGAALGANLARIVLDVARDRRTPRRPMHPKVVPGPVLSGR